VMTQSGQPTD